MTTETLCGMFASGALPLTTSVWCAAARRWVTAQTIPGFRSAGAMAPKPAPAMFSATPPAAARSTDLDRALRNLGDDTLSLRSRFGGMHRVKAGAVAEMICLMPAELDMHAARRAILIVNGLPVSVSGRYMSAGERRGFYDAGVRARSAGAN